MDIKDLLIPSDATMSNGSEATSTAPTTGAPGLPTVTADASTYWKTGGSIVVGMAGMFYLSVGKKTNDVQKMVIGVVLTVASFLLF
jgi:hypothetical protein